MNKYLSAALIILFLINIALAGCSNIESSDVNETGEPTYDFEYKEIILSNNEYKFKNNYNFEFKECELAYIKYEIPTEWKETYRDRSNVIYEAKNGDNLQISIGDRGYHDVEHMAYHTSLLLNNTNRTYYSGIVPIDDQPSFTINGYEAKAIIRYLVGDMYEDTYHLTYVTMPDDELSFTFESYNSLELSEELIYCGKHFFDSIEYCIE